jgi:hypothetical protein
MLTLQNIFPNNNITRRKAHGIAALHLDTTTAGSRYPLLFADYNPDTESINQIGRWDGCHKNVRYKIGVKDGTAATLKKFVNKIHAYLLLDFINIVYLFADDLGDYKHITDRLIR